MLLKKGISTKQVKEIIDKANEVNHLSKNEILIYALNIFSAQDFLKIKQEYATFLSYKANLTDKVF